MSLILFIIYCISCIIFYLLAHSTHEKNMYIFGSIPIINTVLLIAMVIVGIVISIEKHIKTQRINKIRYYGKTNIYEISHSRRTKSYSWR